MMQRCAQEFVRTTMTNPVNAALLMPRVMVALGATTRDLLHAR
jgi:hypothetical protein